MKRYSLSFLGVAAVLVFLLWGCWQWFFCRFYVGPCEMAIITAKVGTPLPPGEILAKEGQQGVQEKVLSEGRHFLNPFNHEVKIVPAILIPPGKIGVVTSKVGKELPEGEFLAEPGQKGIWRQVLGPGRYRLNPVGYQVDIVDAISVPIGYAGVITSLSGTPAPEGEFAKKGEKGVRAEVLQPGLYHINPREFKVDIVEIGVNQVALMGKAGSNVVTKGQINTNTSAVANLERIMLQKQQVQREAYLSSHASAAADHSSKVSSSESGKSREAKMPESAAKAPPPPREQQATAAFVLNQFVEFPSKDGFEISLDMSVEFELLPENIAWIFRNYGDLPAAVEKVIMPQILSVSRLKGSGYGARDFIVGEGREKFQNDLTEALAKSLREKKIVIHNALIRNVNVPKQILTPIQETGIALERDLTNIEKQNTAKKQAELNTQLSLIDQRVEEVKQETEKMKAEIRAQTNKEVAQIKGEALHQVALIRKETAAIRAQKTTLLGKAEADVIRLVEGEKAKGYQLKVKAFGDPVAYNLWTLAHSLRDDLTINILHSGNGTLWTDLQKANLGELGGAKAIEKTQKNQ